MKCSELYQLLLSHGWVPISQKGSHIKLKHPNHTNQIIFPNHGSKEIGKGLEQKIKKSAFLK
ncbi:MAG: type II toxin-antitoxin system HicA family toxin [Bacteroidota bacterium]|jgi:predicted RNA binding protein YcfA (HicA-like mRNA interferase family)